MEGRADVMTDFQMRALLNLIIKIVEDNKSDPEKILDHLIAIRDDDRKTGTQRETRR